MSEADDDFINDITSNALTHCAKCKVNRPTNFQLQLHALIDELVELRYWSQFYTLTFRLHIDTCRQSIFFFGKLERRTSDTAD